MRLNKISKLSAYEISASLPVRLEGYLNNDTLLGN